MPRGRKKNNVNTGVPKYVEKAKDKWVYRPYLGMENGKRRYGPRTVLCSTEATRYELQQAYDLAVYGHQHAYTVSWLMKRYEQSDHVRKKLKVSTRKEYGSYISLISSYPTPDGLTLGAQPLKSIKRTTIRDYLD